MTIRRCLTSTILLMAAPVVAWSQDANVVNPDNVDLLPLARPIVEYTLAGAFLLAALAIGFMPSKRVKDA